MTVKTNTKGAKRKQLANDIGTWLGSEVSYCGAPSFAYQIGSVLIDKDGTIEFPTLWSKLRLSDIKFQSSVFTFD